MVQLLFVLVFMTIYLTLESLWLHYARDTYVQNFSRVTQRPLSVVHTFVRITPLVVFTYALLLLLVWHYCIAPIHEGRITEYSHSFANGALLGVTMYAIYNLTNLATLPGFSYTVALLDTLWGMLSLGVLSMIMLWFKKNH